MPIVGSQIERMMLCIAALSLFFTITNLTPPYYYRLCEHMYGTRKSSLGAKPWAKKITGFAPFEVMN
jgi:hypothetical protein